MLQLIKVAKEKNGIEKQSIRFVISVELSIFLNRKINFSLL
ncbi:hypothetical protein T190423A01A_10257 [Tenacibaculum sp. 190130A14a]|uniref:Uncharacterized protein n=1 Tax=Tenacibaculum polynesiense TaxID=3137857 RepID=A0ABM9P8L7_9FLAO